MFLVPYTRRALAWSACLTLLGPPTFAQEPVPPDARLAWNIDAANTTEAHTNEYALYVDGDAVPLPHVSCRMAALPISFVCSARLPSLAPGRHVLQVSASRRDTGVLWESSRSAPFHVVVQGDTAPALYQYAGKATPPADHTAAAIATRFAPRDLNVALEPIASGLRTPVDIAVVSDDMLLVAERGGTIRVISHGRRRAAATILPNVMPPDALLGLAVDPEFATNGFLYVVSAVRGLGVAWAYRLERHRYAGGVLSQRVVLLDGVPADGIQPAAVVRVAKDGTVYLALGDVDEQRHVPSSYNGKVLRITRHGTTPRDHPTGSPIIASGLVRPRGLAWGPQADMLWVLDAGEQARLDLMNGFLNRPPAASVPLAVDVSSMAMDAVSLPGGTVQGSLLIAANEGVHAVSLQPGSTTRIERLTFRNLTNTGSEQVRVIAAGRAGEFYVATDTALYRVSADLSP